jgi:ABC-type transport system involved in cytochrome bd biosynthesis fused ATPase/permease subunit
LNILASTFVASALTLAAAAASAQPVIGLITKTESNPFFVKMKEDADAEAKKPGARLLSASGKTDGVMDEPTAALGVKEGHMVLELVRRVRDKGLPVILISHDMPHVFEIADRIHIARLGKRAAVVTPRVISMSDTVAVMTGAKLAKELPPRALA